MKYFYALTLCAILCLCSCTSKRSLAYFQDITESTTIPTGDYKVTIQPADELLITVTSSNQRASSLYNMPLINPVTSEDLMTNSTSRQQTYIGDSKGDINFPILGNIHVAGMTLETLKDYLTSKISQDVDDPLVNVQIVNFFVNVVGEVKEPGRYPVKGTRFSVLDAITSAGDLTPYGKREKVMLVREENGQRNTIRLNLNKAETLSSPYFYVKQNDYIYVEPSDVRKYNADYNTNNAFKLSVISTIVSSCSVIASLVIALTR